MWRGMLGKIHRPHFCCLRLTTNTLFQPLSIALLSLSPSPGQKCVLGNFLHEWFFRSSALRFYWNCILICEPHKMNYNCFSSSLVFFFWEQNFLLTLHFASRLLRVFVVCFTNQQPRWNVLLSQDLAGKQSWNGWKTM